MKHLIIYAHPNPKSFNHAILETIEAELKKAGGDYDVRDLYAIGFNPVLASGDFTGFQSGQIPADIKTEQNYVKNADVLIFIHPVWWTGMPAILKGYIDRVMSFGFAYTYGPQGPKGLLTGKKVAAFSTSGFPYDYYEAIGMIKSMSQTQDGGIYNFCDMEVAVRKFFGGVPAVSDAVRKGYLEEVREEMKKVL